MTSLFYLYLCTRLVNHTTVESNKKYSRLVSCSTQPVAIQIESSIRVCCQCGIDQSRDRSRDCTCSVGVPARSTSPSRGTSTHVQKRSMRDKASFVLGCVSHEKALLGIVVRRRSLCVSGKYLASGLGQHL